MYYVMNLKIVKKLQIYKLISHQGETIKIAECKYLYTVLCLFQQDLTGFSQGD